MINSARTPKPMSADNAIRCSKTNTNKKCLALKSTHVSGGHMDHEGLGSFAGLAYCSIGESSVGSASPEPTTTPKGRQIASAVLLYSDGTARIFVCACRVRSCLASLATADVALNQKPNFQSTSSNSLPNYRAYFLIRWSRILEMMRTPAQILSRVDGVLGTAIHILPVSSSFRRTDCGR